MLRWDHCFATRTAIAPGVKDEKDRVHCWLLVRKQPEAAVVAHLSKRHGGNHHRYQWSPRCAGAGGYCTEQSGKVSETSPVTEESLRISSQSGESPLLREQLRSVDRLPSGKRTTYAYRVNLPLNFTYTADLHCGTVQCKTNLKSWCHLVAFGVIGTTNLKS